MAAPHPPGNVFKDEHGNFHVPAGAAIDIDSSGTITLNGSRLTATGDEVNKLDGATVTTAEINKLDGVAVTAAEMDQREKDFNITLGTAGTAHVAVAWDSDLTTIYSTLDAAISGSDETLTLLNNSGATMTGGTITIGTASAAAGDTDSATPTGNNSFTAGQTLAVATDGASSGTVTARMTAIFDIT